MKKHQSLIIGIAITIFLGTGYLYFDHTFFSEAETPVSPDSALSTSSGQPANVSGTPSSNITADTAFLTSLISLTSITVDTSLFTNPLFTNLHDNNVTIDPITPGRNNPFAPIDTTSTTATAPAAPISTNDATQITTNSALLNGAIASTTAPSSVYFEYGPTASFGKTTPTVVPSLVNTFIIKVTGLSSKTTYFYRADAKINGTLVYGDTVSFTTN